MKPVQKNSTERQRNVFNSEKYTLEVFFTKSGVKRFQEYIK